MDVVELIVPLIFDLIEFLSDRVCCFRFDSGEFSILRRR